MSRLMPALSDGRMFTSYLSAGQQEDALQRKFRIVNENEYRRFLQHNSAHVINAVRALQAPLQPVPARRV